MKCLTLLMVAFLSLDAPLFPKQDWKHEGSIFILTTPEGANLPASAMVEGFPLLVRLDKDWFDFNQAKDNGEDIRFVGREGKPLAYQIELWDKAKGTACIWVKIPVIKGNDRQEIKLLWGNPGAQSESDGKAVFNSDNGYVSVLHLDNLLKDELGALSPKNLGTTSSVGIIGESRHFMPGKGIQCGDHITTYPYGDSAFTSEAWVRPQSTSNSFFYWGRYATRLNGKTGDGNEVELWIGSPASFNWSSDGPGGVRCPTEIKMNQWYHVAATYENGTSNLFINGKKEATRFHKSAMSVVRDIVVNIGGMRGGNYKYSGDIDEVRVSKVARSEDWMKLQYENQNPNQTLVGPLVQKGSAFELSHAKLDVLEGTSATVVAKAPGAQKIYWIIKKDGVDTLASVDRFSFTLPPTRVTSNTSMILQFKAVYAEGVKTKDIPIAITEHIPEPIATLKAPDKWNGRDTIEVIPVLGNKDAMLARNAGDVKTTWSVIGGAVIKEVKPDRLILKRSQYSGEISVRAAFNNGGADTFAFAKIMVTEPKSDPWVPRLPGKDEKPVNNQFYARDDKNEGTLYYNGIIPSGVDAVELNLFANDKLVKTETKKPDADKSYGFAFKLKPGLIKYKVEFFTLKGADKTPANTVGNIVCGDAYIIQGQSNAEATGPNNGPTIDADSPLSDWIRSYGNSYNGDIKNGWGNAIRTRIWGKPDYGHAQIGAWGMALANDLVAKYQIPICIMNGAVGGTRIDQHQRNESNPNDPSTIYGRLLNRIQAANLSHGIRGVLWHQGENNQGSASPTGDYDWKSYQQYFVDLSAAWKQDFPNIQNYYVFQIWPSGCNMGGTHAGDMLLEVQRSLPFLYSNMRIMSTLGIVSGSSGRGLCHFDMEGYALIARQICPLLEQDNYGLSRSKVLSAPNLLRAVFTNEAKNEILLQFDQPMIWKEQCKAWIYLDGVAAPITSGKAEGSNIILQLASQGRQLASPDKPNLISYLSGKYWDGKPDKLIYGSNGIAALAIADVPVKLANVR